MIFISLLFTYKLICLCAEYTASIQNVVQKDIAVPNKALQTHVNTAINLLQTNMKDYLIGYTGYKQFFQLYVHSYFHEKTIIHVCKSGKVFQPMVASTQFIFPHTDVLVLLYAFYNHDEKTAKNMLSVRNILKTFRYIFLQNIIANHITGIFFVFLTIL